MKGSWKLTRFIFSKGVDKMVGMYMASFECLTDEQLDWTERNIRSGFFTQDANLRLYAIDLVRRKRELEKKMNNL